MMRSLGEGGTISRVDEWERPVAKPWEKQSHVDFFLHRVYLVGFSWQDRLVSSITGKTRLGYSFELTASSLLGYGFQSLVVLSLSLTDNLEFLDELVLYANSSVALVAVVSSHFRWSS